MDTAACPLLERKLNKKQQQQQNLFLKLSALRFLPHFRFSYYTEGNSQTFKAKGDYYLKTGTLFKTEVKKDVISGGVHATGNAESAKFADMMASFGLDPASLPDFLVNALKWVVKLVC